MDDLRMEDDVVLVRSVTEAVRMADEAFTKSGGSSRHWVRECFLPALEAEGMKIVRVEKPARARAAKGEGGGG